MSHDRIIDQAEVAITLGPFFHEHSQLTKAQKRDVRRLARVVHERQLGAAAAALQLEFEHWQREEIDIFALRSCFAKMRRGSR